MRRVTRRGHSLYIPLPPKWVREMGIKEGDFLQDSIEGGRLILSPLGKEKKLTPLDPEFEKAVKEMWERIGEELEG